MSPRIDAVSTSGCNGATWSGIPEWLENVRIEAEWQYVPAGRILAPSFTVEAHDGESLARLDVSASCQLRNVMCGFRP